MARRWLRGRGDVMVAQRYITRPPQAGGEKPIALSAEQFEQRLRAGCFAPRWDSHGRRYRLGLEIDRRLALG